MRPKEFVSRVIDLFYFDLGQNWSQTRPKSFSAAAMCIEIADNKEKASTVVTNGYHFRIESRECLGHTIIRAIMEEDGQVIHGSIGFTFHSGDLSVQGLVPMTSGSAEINEFHEAWHVSPDLREYPDRIASMITFLTLRTNYTITSKI